MGSVGCGAHGQADGNALKGKGAKRGGAEDTEKKPKLEKAPENLGGLLLF